MSVQIIYKTLFRCNILHHYFLNEGNSEFLSELAGEQEKRMKLYQLNQIFTIVPTPHCRQQLQNYHLIFRTTSSGFVVLAKVEDGLSLTSWVDLSQLKLTFYLKSKQVELINYTNIPLADSDSQIFYFSNLAGTKGATFPNLTLPYSAYATAQQYDMGTIVQHGGLGYEALENIANSSGTPNTQPALWKSINTEAYVSSSDNLPLFAQFVPYTLSSEPVELKISLTNSNNSILKTEILEAQEIGLERKYPLTNFPDGCYHLKVQNNGTDAIIYESDFIHVQPSGLDQIFGLIEIFGDATGNYALVNAGKLLNTPPEFVIRLKNRNTYWRYLNATDQTEVFSHPDPLPLTHNGNIDVIFNTKKLPNPTAGILKPETQKVFSDIYIKV